MQGNLWTAAGITLPKREGESNVNPAGIYVISPQGRLLDRIPIPEDVVTNMTFGGGDKKTLYVTAGKSLFKIGIKRAWLQSFSPVESGSRAAGGRPSREDVPALNEFSRT